MPITVFDNLDLLITPDGDHFQARVIQSPVGETPSVDFSLPFVAPELGRFTWLSDRLSRSLRLAGPTPPDPLSPQQFGAKLFDTVFTGPIQDTLVRSVDAANHNSHGLRIRLRLADVPNLADLPWEYLFASDMHRFLALSDGTPVVRYLELNQPVAELRVTPPLCVLAVVSNPKGVPPLTVEQEWTHLHDALADLQSKDLVRLERLEHATLAALQERLRQKDKGVHILHFIGHGEFDPAANTGGLAFEDDAGNLYLVSADQLAMLLHDTETLRLVFLNACEGAQSSQKDAFSGVAQTLVQQGVPVVIAMQCEIGDAAAVALATSFYGSLADGCPVDTALSEARKALSASGDDLEWGTQVLFSRSADHYILAPPDAKAVVAVAEAGTGLTALGELMNAPKVHDLVVAFQTDFEAARAQLEAVGAYKSAHDQLHNLQFTCFDLVSNEVSNFPDGAGVMDRFGVYDSALEQVVTALQDLAKGSQVVLDDTGWIGKLVDAETALHTAIDKSDPQPLKKSLWLMKQVLDVQPTTIDTHLYDAAGAMRLPSLAKALQQLQAQLAGSGQSPSDSQSQVYLQQLQSGVTSMVTLSDTFTKLTADHHAWQGVELDLRQTEANLVSNASVIDTSYLEMSWPDTKAHTAPLYTGCDDDWATALKAEADKLDAAIAANPKDPKAILQSFRRFRSKAGLRFFQVDTQLNQLCGELRKVGEPLASILKMM